ncbi:unnamed protein product [Vitrella brassicaformis CCMP3155]|uniref:Uncharacterized protein n=1 Tax=Vitrella brassicaformis (strain CCMP3155) TaxID=1169540 RepID=A0A0G4GMP8_VITBC|nr:unnamed protein product [Vitrella brassicaformis CCMP3155]|eukprot:CEM31472.1 unnamed protein product [Vitrella brassicaformis CCMP3155]
MKPPSWWNHSSAGSPYHCRKYCVRERSTRRSLASPADRKVRTAAISVPQSPGNNGVGQGGQERRHCRAKAAALGAEAKQEPLPEVRVASSRPNAPAQASCSALHR